MSSQEELVGCLLQLTDVLARRLSIVRDGNKPCVANARERDADEINGGIPRPSALRWYLPSSPSVRR